METLNPLIAYKDDPITDRIHHPYTAFNQGYDAHEHGHAQALNPYPDGPCKTFWDDGWTTAAEEGGEG